MLTDLLELLLDVSIWEADNPRISTRRHRIFQGIFLLFLLVFLAVDGLLLYVGIVSSNGKLILCGIFLLACIAIITKTEVFSLIIGGLFVAEACSVILQVVHYKRTKKRLFLMAPLHHHFEKKGWSETKVVIRFWIVSGALAGFGFVLFFIQPIVMGMVA